MPEEVEEEEEEETKVDARVKELYRILVRRLHPDLRADASAAVSALWHEVQEAYAASDVAHMEILLALSDIESQQRGRPDQHRPDARGAGGIGDEPCARWRRACSKPRAKMRGISRRPGRMTICGSVERELKSDLAARSTRLDVLTNTIAAWAHGPIANRKAVPAARRYSARAGAGR